MQCLLQSLIASHAFWHVHFTAGTVLSHWSVPHQPFLWCPSCVLAVSCLSPYFLFPCAWYIL